MSSPMLGHYPYPNPYNSPMGYPYFPTANPYNFYPSNPMPPPMSPPTMTPPPFTNPPVNTPYNPPRTPVAYGTQSTVTPSSTKPTIPSSGLNNMNANTRPNTTTNKPFMNIKTLNLTDFELPKRKGDLTHSILPFRNLNLETNDWDKNIIWDEPTEGMLRF